MHLHPYLAKLHAERVGPVKVSRDLGVHARHDQRVHARHVHLVLRGGAPPFPPAAAAVATTRAVDAIRLVEDGVATRACGGGAVVFVPQKSPSATSSPGSRACRPRPCRAYPAAAAMSIPSELNRLWVTDEARHERPVDGGWG